MTLKVNIKGISPVDTQIERLVRKLRFGHLQLLEALHRCGTILEAAQQLKLSRSAVSKSLGEIEAAAGCAQFERSRRGLKANAIGLVYLRGARRMLNDLEASVADASLARP
jgi:DNA-binding transcriptional LysR family regulator